jgi:hypothetical protein
MNFSCAMQDPALQGHSTPEPLSEIKPGLWVSSKLVDGNRLYFALQNKLDTIGGFRNFAYNVGGGDNEKTLSKAILYVAAKCNGLVKNECANSRSLEKLRIFGLDTPETRSKFVDYIYNSGIDLEKIFSFMESIPAGAGHADRKGQDIFAWISTQPITDYRDFGYLGAARHDREVNLQQAYPTNHDLVMLVSASFTNHNLSQLHQYIDIAGIFKPPHEMLYGKHKNIALLFHGFIAHVAKAQGKKVYYIGDPATPMARILNAVFHQGKQYRGVSASSADLYGDIDGNTLQKEGIEIQGVHSRVFIKTESLEKFFTQAH